MPEEFIEMKEITQKDYLEFIKTHKFARNVKNLNSIKDESLTHVTSNKNNACYFLIAVSNKENLDLCIKYSIAGFPNTINGFWTFCEIRRLYLFSLWRACIQFI